MPQFYPLTVTRIHRTIRKAVVLTLKPNDPEIFKFTQGQYLTFRKNFGEIELRHNYSICSGDEDGVLQVGIKQVDGGAFSTYANTNLKVGDQLEAMPPMGDFYAGKASKNVNSYLSFAGGSGITPILSLLRSVLSEEPKSDFTLIYANQAVRTIMFREELEDLKSHFMDRLAVIHILESGQDIDLFSGRIDQNKCEALFKSWINIENINIAYICGPEPMMIAATKALSQHGLRKNQIKFELFGISQGGLIPQKSSSKKLKDSLSTRAKITLDGATHSIEIAKDQSVLETALYHNLDVPHACRAGVCSTCKAKIIEGEFQMLTNHSLEDYEVEAGYVLTCQCYPLSDTLIVDYDQH